MAYTSENLGERCRFCDEGYVIQYRSGKYGCDKYCWKNSPNYTPKPQQATPKQAPVLENFATKQDLVALKEWMIKVANYLDAIQKVVNNIECNLIGKKEEE